MVKFSRQFTFTTTIALVTFSAIDLPKTQAASLYLGLSQYVENIQIDSDKNTNKDASVPNLSITRRNTQKNSQFSTTEAINQDIAEHYNGLVDENTDSIGLIESQRILKEQGLLEDDNQSIEELTDIINTDNPLSNQTIEAEKEQKQITQYVLYSLILIFGLGSILISKKMFFGQEGLLENLQDKYGKPKVPEGTVYMHNHSFEELVKIGIEVERINSEKFSNEEFLLFVKVKQSIGKGVGDFQTLGNRSELLQVAIAAQNSFLRIEQTELRFRSRNQQEFYQFVVESLDQDLEEIKFRGKVKRKLAEIIPLINTEEGRNALQSYLKEIDKISKHKLGLKLLSLFKKYQLADFTILKRVSDIVNQLKGQDLLKAKNLISLVINDYEIFEKLAPIIGVSTSENSPETYANILQYIGLLSRHEKSYEEFQRLIERLEKWRKPYKMINIIRQEYQASEYRLPKEFSQEIPGLNVYKKCEKFLEDNQ